MWDIVDFLRTVLVGETFMYGSIRLKAMESVPGGGCAGCHFIRKKRQCKLTGACVASLRRDGRSVIFADEWGSPKARARARMAAESRVTLEAGGAEWRDVPGYEGLYRVSDDGRVMSVGMAVKYGGRPRVVPLKARMMTPRRSVGGFMWLCLWCGGSRRYARVCDLVARAFVPNPGGLGRVARLNGDPADDRAANLAWAEAAEKPGGGSRMAIKTGK